MKRNEDLIKAMTRLLRRPRTIAELMEETGASRRTVYRYLGHLARVTRVGITRPTKYWVARG